MSMIVTLLCLAVVAVVLYDFTAQYRASALTGWARVWAAWSGGAADIKKQLGFVAAGLLTFSDKVANWIGSVTNDPSAADSIKTVIGHVFTGANVGMVFAALVLIGVTLNLRKA